MRKKKKRYIVSGLVFICAIVLFKTQVVSFRDKEFEGVVRNHLLPGCVSVLVKREEKIKGPVLRKKTNSVDDIYIDLNKYKIKDMRDLEYFKKLEVLCLSYVPEDPQADIIPNGDMPQNLDVINKLNYLEKIYLYRMNINNNFKKAQTSIKKIFIYNCIVEDDNFIKSFPGINFLLICDSTVSSFEFLEETQKLSYLYLSDNTYDCLLDQLKMAHNIEVLKLISDEPDVFEQLPYIPTIKRLYLKGEGAPNRAEAEKYLKWENLEKLYINGENYDVKSGIWSKN